MSAEQRGPAMSAERESVAKQLVALARASFDFFSGADRKLYAARKDTHVAYLFSENGGAMRNLIASKYMDLHGKPPGRNAMSEALDVLRGDAQQGEVLPVHLRTARDVAAVYIDTGSDTKCWRVASQGTVLMTDIDYFRFRRTELTAPMVDIFDGSDDDTPMLFSLDDLRQILNVTRGDWPLVVGWMVATLLDDGPVPVLLLTGLQGTGKTSTAKRVVSLVDPSTAPIAAAPRDVESWIVTANASRVVALDNLSVVPEWLSDALCRAVTGEGLRRRKLYTDGDIAVTSFRRSVILTSIDAGAIRGDLAERLLTVELEPITPGERRSESDLEQDFADIARSSLTGLLNLTSQVLAAELAGIEAHNKPRMADFADVLARIDHVTGWQSLDTYRTSVARTLADAVSGDRLAEAVVELSRLGPWRGSAGDLLAALATWRPDDGRNWPRSARGLTGALKRLAVPLRTQSVEVTFGRDHERWVAVRRCDDASVATVVPLSQLYEKREEGESAQ